MYIIIIIDIIIINVIIIIIYIYIKRSVCAKRSNDSTKVRT